MPFTFTGCIILFVSSFFMLQIADAAIRHMDKWDENNPPRSEIIAVAITAYVLMWAQRIAAYPCMAISVICFLAALKYSQ